MSNFLAIATVTATLRRALQSALDADVPGAGVTTARPDGAGGAAPALGANIYLYQVTPNAAWRNADLPMRNSDGKLVQRPRAALELHYLLTCHGDEGQLESQRVLGSLVRTLHERPLLNRQMIQDTLAAPTFNYLANSNLADEVEVVKFTPAALSLEELSKLWSVFFQTPYTLSVAYQGSVVFIDSVESPRATLPVRERNVYAIPFRQPVIETVESATDTRLPILSHSTLIIRGKQLRGQVTQVLIGGKAQIPDPQDVTDTEIRVPMPGGLLAGVQSVRISQQIEMGTPPTPHHGFESNVTAFVLIPRIKVPSALSVNNNGLFSTELKLEFDPPLKKTQRVVVLLNESRRASLAYSFKVSSLNQPGVPEMTSTVTVPISDLEAGEYYVRVQVDGAESSLLELDPNSPKFKQLIDPQLTIP